MLTVKIAKRNTIAVPEDLLEVIGIEAGATVDIRVNKKGALIITKEKDDFLGFEGALTDIDIERPLKELNKTWKAWKPRKSL